MQSRCNGTRVSDGHEILESVTACKIFVGTWENNKLNVKDNNKLGGYIVGSVGLI